MTTSTIFRDNELTDLFEGWSRFVPCGKPFAAWLADVINTRHEQGIEGLREELRAARDALDAAHRNFHDLNQELEAVRGELDGTRKELEAERAAHLRDQRDIVREWFDAHKDETVRIVGDLNDELEKENEKLRAQVRELEFQIRTNRYTGTLIGPKEGIE